VIEQLHKIIRAAELLGARSSIVGVDTAIARTFAALGLDMRGVRTFNDLRRALAELVLAR
jgi:anti-anti-sigma regulatory factor